MATAFQSHAVIRITGIVLALIGLYLTIGGGWLVALGGSPYYVITGIAMILSGTLLFRSSSIGLWLYAAILLGTLIWAVWEAGLDFWPLAPRGGILVLLGIWLLLPWVSPGPGSTSPRMALLATLVLALMTLGVSLTRSVHDTDGALPATAQAAMPPRSDLASQPEEDWQAYGRTWFGDRFSPVSQITPRNVKDLKVAWTFRTGDMHGPNDPLETTMEVTPLKVNHMVYLCSPHQIVFALDAATGQLKWKFDPHVHDNPSFQHLTCRGVSYHETKPRAVTAAGTPAPADCPKRIFLGTNDAQMFALDADTGIPCENFGTHGQINLDANMPYVTPGFYEITSPQVVTDKILVVGGAVIDNYTTKEPSGVIRGFDVY